jgi:hypothetical protein
MTAPDPLSKRVETLQGLLIAFATNDPAPPGDYSQLRRELLENPLTKASLPRFVHTCRDPAQFWQFIKHKFPTYAERRNYIWSEFRLLLDVLEARPSTGVELTDHQLLSKLSTEAVQAVWQRALDRRVTDPEGAITAARSLLESVCKHILDDLKCSYDDTSDLPKLYRLTSDALSIAPSQHTEHVFKQILGGCTSVIEGLAALRNRLGDAHGAGRKRSRPAPRHAQLAVNLAGAMTAFLVATWECRKKVQS